MSTTDELVVPAVLETSTDGSAALPAAAASIEFGDLSAAEVNVAKRGILHTLGVAIVSTRLARSDVEPAESLARELARSDGVQVPGSEGRLRPHGHPLDPLWNRLPEELGDRTAASRLDSSEDIVVRVSEQLANLEDVWEVSLVLGRLAHG